MDLVIDIQTNPSQSSYQTFLECLFENESNNVINSFICENDVMVVSDKRPIVDIKTNPVFDISPLITLSFREYSLINSKGYKQLAQKIENEFLKHSSLVDGYESQAKQQAIYFAEIISTLPAENISVELTSLERIIFKTKLNYSEFIIITCQLSKQFDSLNNIAVFSYFVDNKLIISDSAKLEELIEGFRRYKDSV